MVHTPIINTLINRKPMLGNGEIRMAVLDSFKKTFSKRDSIVADAGGRVVAEMAAEPLRELVSNGIRKVRG